ncbi:MAG: nuclear transport factor 2 family protein [Saprospiraceae bacterium]
MQRRHHATLAKMAFLILSLLTVGLAHAQDDRQQILANRQASNQALQSYDHEKVLSFLTDEVLTTVSNGTLLCGKEALRNFILAVGNNKMYWIRTPATVEINRSLGLAWESGTWKGYDPEKGQDPVVGGNYAAMWTKASGQWLTKSELFVALK